MTITTTYAPAAGGALYDSLADLLTAGFPAGAAVQITEVDTDADTMVRHRSTIAELAELNAWHAKTGAYVRGIETHRCTTARLRPSRRVLTAPAIQTELGGRRTRPALRTTGSVIRTVASSVKGDSAGYRSPRLYTVTFTDETSAIDLAPIQSWNVLTGPTS